jgi:FHA domain/Double zinc ribbon
VTTYTCPNGHVSTTGDFCDTCGEPIPAAAASAGGAAPAAPPPPSSLSLPPSTPGAAAAPTVAHKACPNCGDDNVADAMFCEACGYDFTTGQLPPPEAMVAPPAVVTPGSPPDLTGAKWVAEVWIDPDFFAAQQAAGICPTGGAPTIFPLRNPEVFIGRRSKSAGTTPDIDCSGDAAVSHQQAKLTLDHDRWYLEDLGSTNGTFVGTPTSMPPQPLAGGDRHELGDSERIYVGAWTRIVVRRATPDEQGAPPAP